MTSAYEYQKLVLQILQSKAPGTWNLKMPSHSVHIDTLLKVFPDVRIIWAHRDPYKATGSLCNLWKLPKEVVAGQTDIDYTAMGANAAKQMKAHVERPLRARRTHRRRPLLPHVLPRHDARPNGSDAQHL